MTPCPHRFTVETLPDRTIATCQNCGIRKIELTVDPIILSLKVS